MKVTSSFPSAIWWNCYKLYPSEVQPVLWLHTFMSCSVLFLPGKCRCLMWTYLGPFSLSTYMNLNVWVSNNPWTSEWHLGIVNIWMGDFSKRKPTWVQIILPVLTTYIAIFDRSGLWILSSKRKLIILMGAFESTRVSLSDFVSILGDCQVESTRTLLTTCFSSQCFTAQVYGLHWTF